MKKSLIVSVFLILSMLLAACSSAPSGSQTPEQSKESSAQGTDKITVEDKKGTVEIPDDPKRIVDV